MVKPKIVSEGQPCRKCGAPVVKRTHNRPSKPNQAYWFQWWFACPKCKAQYMVEEARVKQELEQPKGGGVSVTVYVDGGCQGNGTDHGAMYGSWVYEGLSGGLNHRTYGIGTNNQAEYLALIDALRGLLRLDLGGAGVRILMDSQLIVQQVNGRWKVKEPNLQPLRVDAADLLKRVGATLEWVSRNQIVAKLGH